MILNQSSRDKKIHEEVNPFREEHRKNQVPIPQDRFEKKTNKRKTTNIDGDGGGRRA